MDNNFERIADMARDVVDVFTKKTDEILSVSKLKIKKSNLNSELRDAYQKLGGAVYEAKKSCTNNDELITLIITEIDEITAAIEKINKQIDEISSQCKCSNCGTVNIKDACYCQHCGSIIKMKDGCCNSSNTSNNGSCCGNNHTSQTYTEPVNEEYTSEDVNDNNIF